MKKIVLAVVILFAATTVFAQTKAGKIDNTKHIVYYSLSKIANVIDQNLSQKEKLKMQVTKVFATPVQIQITSNNSGLCPWCAKMQNLSLKEKMKAELVGIYNCPMNPGIGNDKSGKCPKCEMSLATK